MYIWGFMEESIETSVSAQKVWQMWEKAHNNLEVGQKGKTQFKYQILDIKKGEGFSILWKTLFVRLIFSHSVIPTDRGSKITYQVKIKGLFAWPVRFFIGEKVRKNISSVLKSIVRELEDESVKEPGDRT